MSNEMIEYLISKAATNWKHHIRQTVNKKVLFLLGSPGCGKSSLGAAMMERWGDEKALLIPEVGGDLRRLSASTSEMFEAPFEFATLALEIANMSCITMEDFGNAPLIVDGGIIQDYVHLRMRRENLDEKFRDTLLELYDRQMIEWFKCLSNARFLLLRHRDQRDYNKRFELVTYCSLTWLLSRGVIGVDYFISIDSELVSLFLRSHGNIPSLEDFFERLGNVEKLRWIEDVEERKQWTI